ncbi:Ltp family lipoprotein [Pseudonocardia sp. KRD-184]|uniref:Ltp family lipoprotein n=1 Tax=Pseudonocardia oceani TaxID=2792013 RepID=A0ABS6U7F0_9PSEU|nr:Ltp family lipoprotein [Pseudonocardia oceani]MBW0093762.1 Ltp family lipoprotein [Pseudonocardia oceani]MBW0095410.1 Ltp family lipoprotein [Pseudonocardia oceani]MBW0113147.1 Ltp family lipoprotein [Pseudonocardia oceani]MBW0123132.1 Ltp family lipoprotein [Pseudonocardia oceani]MBW0127918.1 Ltp family lipoprotein [Pseudonocardia oceani]
MHPEQRRPEIDPVTERFPRINATAVHAAPRYDQPRYDQPPPGWAPPQQRAYAPPPQPPAVKPKRTGRTVLAWSAGAVVALVAIAGLSARTPEAAPAPTVAAQEAPAAVVEAPAPEPSMTVSQSNAVRKAEDYLSYMGFSRSGLVDQLEFEGFSTADATFAVDTVTVDWMEQAAKKAQSYMDYTGFSRSGLIDQLEFEGFTAEQARHGADSVGL